MKEKLRGVIEKNIGLSARQERMNEITRQIILSSRCEIPRKISGPKDEEQFGNILKEHTKDPVISFNFAKKPSPKKGFEIEKPQKWAMERGGIEIKEHGKKEGADEYIDEQGNAIKVEANEGPLNYCKAKLSKYFC